jgi:hypothetical protein
MSAREQLALDEALQASTASGSVAGVVVGRLLAIADGGRTPLVTYPGLPSVAALPARTALDLHGAHVGRNVVIALEGGDILRPIVMGVLRESEIWPLPTRPPQVEADADGESLVVTARKRLVLRCGNASITLDADGRVTLRGRQIVSHADGANRVIGGSVQLN